MICLLTMLWTTGFLSHSLHLKLSVLIILPVSIDRSTKRHLVTSLHFTPLHSTTHHFTSLHTASLQITPSHSTLFLFTPPHSTPHYLTPFHTTSSTLQYLTAIHTASEYHTKEYLVTLNHFTSPHINLILHYSILRHLTPLYITSLHLTSTLSSSHDLPPLQLAHFILSHWPPHANLYFHCTLS